MPGRSPTWLTRALVSFHHLVYWALVTCQTRSLVYARLQWRAKRVPPRVPGTFRFPFGRIRYMDARSLAHQFAEIFVDRGYEITGLGTTPRIIDCGGNIGLSTIWFRLHYPGAVITVFEADPNIAEMLTWNLRS